MASPPNGWPERHDCALISSKGFSTRAARDLIDKIAAHGEPCNVFCAHDSDAYGTIIYQTLQEATRARGARKVKIINLGLEPWEAVAAGLEIENLDDDDGKAKPVADYVLERDDGDRWAAWLQVHRTVLNAMTTPEFIEWLDRKMESHGARKLVPPPSAMSEELERRLHETVRTQLTEEILREAGLDIQVRDALNAIKRPTDAELIGGVKKMFSRDPQQSWRAHVDAVVAKLAGASRKRKAK